MRQLHIYRPAGRALPVYATETELDIDVWGVDYYGLQPVEDRSDLNDLYVMLLKADGKPSGLAYYLSVEQINRINAT